MPIRNTHGRYRKHMKFGYSKLLYSQRNKDETIVSVIKRLFGEHITSGLVSTQNRELSLRCIAYNMHRLTNLIIILMVSTEPNSIYQRCFFSCSLSPTYSPPTHHILFPMYVQKVAERILFPILIVFFVSPLIWICYQ